ncbi:MULTISPECIES: hypothetical protein [unclassified Prochlorococcus]|uniref:hypothetical protein n=1 Tax=unclassified Prochlorococcus TaxID=2627481 RepID=UPI0005338C3D|nr:MULTISPECIES: hypothetical protein [unclassified Prochlorococcus]KGG16176.1 hypothetical protein EV06_0886 [Prochlorococcus sp. MIT 0602]KGG17296.1 hypothetical protein EV07_0734 [Prochlorococcus sp. MIT 0603]
MVKRLYLVFLGVAGGLWVSWPGIIRNEAWVCAKNVIIQSNGKGTPLKVALSVPPKFFLSRRAYKGTFGKIRIMGDTCFR